MRSRFSPAVLLCVAALTATSPAAVVASSGASFVFAEIPGLTSRGIPRLQVTLTEDITIALKPSLGGDLVNIFQFILPDVYTSNAGGYASSPETAYSASAAIHAEIIKAGTGQAIPMAYYNSWGTSSGTLFLNNPKGFLGFFERQNNIRLEDGDLLVIRAGTVDLGYYSPILPDRPATTLVIADEFGRALSDPINVVPEPGSLVLGTLGAFVLVGQRRRKRA